MSNNDYENDSDMSSELMSNINAPNKGKKWSKDDEKTVLQLTTNGKTAQEIGEQIGRTKRAVEMKLLYMAYNLKKAGKDYDEIQKYTKVNRKDLDAHIETMNYRKQLRDQKQKEAQLKKATQKMNKSTSSSISTSSSNNDQIMMNMKIMFDLLETIKLQNSVIMNHFKIQMPNNE